MEEICSYFLENCNFRGKQLFSHYDVVSIVCFFYNYLTDLLESGIKWMIHFHSQGQKQPFLYTFQLHNSKIFFNCITFSRWSGIGMVYNGHSDGLAEFHSTFKGLILTRMKQAEFISFFLTTWFILPEDEHCKKWICFI